MYFVYRDGAYIDASGQSFRDFLDGRLPALPGEVPTITDWDDHLTTLFPEVRMKRFLEMRGADGGPWRSLCALPAIWVGVLYHQPSLDAAFDLVKDWTIEEHQALRDQVPGTGLATPFRSGTVLDLARSMVEIAADGLKARAEEDWAAQDERQFLTFLKGVIETRPHAGRGQACRLRRPLGKLDRSRLRRIRLLSDAGDGNLEHFPVRSIQPAPPPDHPMRGYPSKGRSGGGAGRCRVNLTRKCSRFQSARSPPSSSASASASARVRETLAPSGPRRERRRGALVVLACRDHVITLKDAGDQLAFGIAAAPRCRSTSCAARVPGKACR